MYEHPVGATPSIIIGLDITSEAPGPGYESVSTTKWLKGCGSALKAQDRSLAALTW